MSDYMRGVVYMIHHKQDLELYEPYIGSTFDFDKRMKDHKINCYNPNNEKYNYKLYQHIRENGGWENYDVKIIEYYDCKGKRELEKREDEIMLNFHNRLNKNRACRNSKEWRNDNKYELAKWYKTNKLKLAEYKKQYREDNRYKIAEYFKEHYKQNKEKLLEYHKEWYETNKQKVAEYKKQYRQANKDKINQKVICDRCGFEGNKYALPRHKKSLKCINFKPA